MTHPSRAPAATLLLPLLRQADAWLQRCVESALLQSVACEVLVVTHPATPQSNLDVLARLESTRSLRVVCRPAGARFAGGLNHGFAAASCERVGLLLTDDWLEPDAVEAALAVDADIVSSQARVVAADGRRVVEIEALGRRRTNAALAACVDDESRARLLGHFLLLSRSAVRQAGGVDETVGDTPGVDDYHLLWTMLERGASAAIVERALYNYRDHAGERLTNRHPLQMWETMRRILAKHGLDGDALEERLSWHTRWFGGPLSQTTDPRVQQMRWIAAPARASSEPFDERVTGWAESARTPATLEVHARRIARRTERPLSETIAALIEASIVGALVPAAAQRVTDDDARAGR